MIGHLLAVATTEFRIGLRNRWVLLATVVLLVFALVLGALGAAPRGDVKADGLTVAVASLATLSVYVVPLIALLLAFDAVAGEIERGTLPLLLATPAARSSVLFGKFFGHLGVLAAAILLGYGAAGAAIFFFADGGGEGVAALGRLIATSILLGAAFLGAGYVASALVRQTGAAGALAVGIWLLAVVLYDLGLLAALLAAGDGVFAREVFPWLLAANPADAFRIYNLAALEGSSTGTLAAPVALPFPAHAAIASVVLWIAVTLAVATRLVGRLEP